MPKASAQDASRVADFLSNALPHHPIVRWGSSRPAAPLIAAADALERLEMPPAEVIQKKCSVGALDLCRVDCCLFRSVTSDMCVILAFCCKLGLSSIMLKVWLQAYVMAKALQYLS